MLRIVTTGLDAVEERGKGLVRTDHDARLHLAQDERERGDAVRVVQRHQHGAAPLGCEVGDHPVLAVVRKERHGVVLSDAQRRVRGTQVGHVLAHLRPRAPHIVAVLVCRSIVLARAKQLLCSSSRVCQSVSCGAEKGEEKANLVGVLGKRCSKV